MTFSAPPNTQTTLRFPFPRVNATLEYITVFEGGVACFQQGAFSPGIPGVLSARYNNITDLVPGQVTVDVVVQSGSYSFSSFYGGV